jgi:hypothetical protein
MRRRELRARQEVSDLLSDGAAEIEDDNAGIVEEMVDSRVSDPRFLAKSG